MTTNEQTPANWANLTDQQRNQLVHQLVARSATQPVPNYVQDLNIVRELELQQDTTTYGLNLSHAASRIAYARGLSEEDTASFFYHTLATMSADQRCEVLCATSVAN